MRAFGRKQSDSAALTRAFCCPVDQRNPDIACCLLAAGCQRAEHRTGKFSDPTLVRAFIALNMRSAAAPSMTNPACVFFGLSGGAWNAVRPPMDIEPSSGVVCACAGMQNAATMLNATIRTAVLIDLTLVITAFTKKVVWKSKCRR